MNLKLHIVGVSLIVVMALIGLIVSGRIHFGEPPSAPGEDLFVQVEQASWGMNCLSKMKPAATKGEPPAVRTNNVLRRISSLCNGQVSCTVKIDASVLGDDPAPGCGKNLVVDYRCQIFTRSRHATGHDGETVTIDCNPPPAVPPSDGSTPAAANGRPPG